MFSAYLHVLFGLFILHHVGAYPQYLRWPKEFHFKATLNIPSANLTQPYEVWWNGTSGNHRFDFYKGMSKLYEKRNGRNVTGPYRYYWVGPESTNINPNALVCHRLRNTSREVKLINTYLPPLKYYLNEKGHDGNQTKWEYQATGGYGSIFNYAVWTTGSESTWVPVRYEYRMVHKGIELDFIQHIYEKFTAAEPDPSVFQIPRELRCKSSKYTDKDFDSNLNFFSPIPENNMTEEFERFKYTHNKQYKTEDEHFMRFQVFQKNFRYIQYMNRQQESYKLAVNQLTDLTEEELAMSLGTKIEPELIDLSSTFEDDVDDEENHNLDWRWYKAVTPVKDQTTLCGSCYAFATAAAVESAAYISKGCEDMEEASEQALIDCSRGIGNSGCNGGYVRFTLQWVKKHGIPLRSDYGPYLAMEGYCNLNQSKFLHISGFEKLPRKVTSIKNALRNNGPLSAAINVPFSLFYYASGIYDDKNCSSDPLKLSHAIVIIGYGKENGKRYWLIKNSYGTQWGDGGYFKLDMDNNLCGITNAAYEVIYKNSLAKNCKAKNFILTPR